jgi:hypothetical protein
MEIQNICSYISLNKELQTLMPSTFRELQTLTSSKFREPQTLMPSTFRGNMPINLLRTKRLSNQTEAFRTDFVSIGPTRNRTTTYSADACTEFHRKSVSSFTDEISKRTDGIDMMSSQQSPDTSLLPISAMNNTNMTAGRTYAAILRYSCSKT